MNDLDLQALAAIQHARLSAAQTTRRRAGGWAHLDDPADRFWQKVRVGPGCWEWQAARGRTGYGKAGWGDIKTSAHRVALLALGVEVSDGQEAAHECDNPPCVRPSHLFLATHQENVADSVAKGRNQKGVINGKSRLTPALVRLIRTSQESGPKLGARLGVSDETVYAVRRRQTWRHVA